MGRHRHLQEKIGRTDREVRELAMAKTLRIGMIGYGFMGRTHSNAYKRLNDFFPVEHRPVLKAVCARDACKAQVFADNWGYERVETDWRKVVEAGDIDLIDIGSPNNTHYEIALAAARHGKMVLCEKPLAMNVKEAEEMTKAVEAARVPNMVWFNYRRVPSVALAKQVVDEGRIGQAFHYRATYLQDWTISPDVPQGGAGLWRLDATVAGSGVTGDLLAHSIDTAMWLNGAITRVTAKTATFVKERYHSVSGKLQPVGIDDACMFLAEFANGSIGTFESTRYARGRKNYNTFELNGENGSLFFDLEEPEYLQFFEYKQLQSGKKTESHLTGWRKIHTTNSEHPYMNRYWVPGTCIGYEHTFLNALADFVMGIESGQPTQPDFRNALQTQRVCDAVLESARSGQWLDTGVSL
jgi:predicted dehydrogenase